jgi:uncharacterized protein (DUF433 family)
MDEQRVIDEACWELFVAIEALDSCETRTRVRRFVGLILELARAEVQAVPASESALPVGGSAPIKPAVTIPAKFADRLIYDPNVSTDSPCIRGTWVTVARVLAHLIDGYSWDQVLCMHPEISNEHDIRACVDYNAFVAEGKPVSKENKS